ncbi:MAG TPA: ATP-grasp domain-containing protein, partial [Gaiellales bacterium]
RAEDFLAAAAAVGAEVVVASDRRQALHAAMGDRSIRVDLRRPDRAAAAIADLAERVTLDAVVAVDDGGVATAALASERLGLPHNPPAAVAATRDKAAMRRALAAAGVPQPGFAVLAAGDDAGAVALPAVLKPVALSGSRGVIRADDPAAARRAEARIRAILDEAGEDPDGPILAERYVPGAEVAVEALLRGGELEVLAVFDKPDPLEGPYFEETIYVTPSRLPAGRLDRIAAATAAAAATLGLREGPVHAELRLDGDELFVLELAARSIGGLCGRALRFGAGISLEEVILRHALRLPLGPHERERAASGVMMLPIERAGTLREVQGLDAARAVAGIEDVRITIPVGRPVVPLPEGDRYLGFAFARADEPAAVEAALRAAHAALRVVVD